MRLAEGIAVFCPDMSSLLRPASQERNIRQVEEHILWLLSDASPVNVNKERIMLAGHSAGFPVVLEATVALHSRGVFPACLLALDGVPWPRTLVVGANLDLTKTKLVSIRCEPGSWNKNGELHTGLILPKLVPKCGTITPAASILDIKIPGSGHGDPIDPMKNIWMMKMMGLVGKKGCAEAFVKIIDGIGRDLTVGRLSSGNVSKDSGCLEETWEVLKELRSTIQAKEL